MSRLFTRVTVSLLLVLLWGAAASADYKDYIGFTQLKTELGSSTPTGAGVVVSQVEAGWDTTHNVCVYLPDRQSIAEFSGKTFTPLLPTSPTDFRPRHHRWQVFLRQFHLHCPRDNLHLSTMMPDYWLGSAFLNTGYAAQPLTTSARVANHSWVGAYVNQCQLPMSTPSNASIG